MDADLELLSASLSGGQDASACRACPSHAIATGIGFSSRRRRGRSATAAGSVTRTMTRSVERDKTRLRRCRQRGRSQCCCLLRRGDKRRHKRRDAQEPAAKQRVRPPGRGGYDRASGSEPAKQALSWGMLITSGEKSRIRACICDQGTLMKALPVPRIFQLAQDG